jgi:hypothetical protein
MCRTVVNAMETCLRIKRGVYVMIDCYLVMRGRRTSCGLICELFCDVPVVVVQIIVEFVVCTY